MTAYSDGFCPYCKRHVQTSRPTPNHLLHLLMSLVTAGVWVVVWALVILKHEPWRCTVCGRNVGFFAHFEQGIKGDTSPAPQIAAGERICPFCKEAVKAEAIKCKHCGERLEPTEIVIS